MKKWLVVSVVVNVAFILGALFVVMRFPSWIDDFVSVMAERRATQFAVLDDRTGGIVFLGDSITEGGMWNELFPSVDVRNRGIGGDTTQDLLNRIDEVHAIAPDKLFLMIGINDLNRGVPLDTTLANIEGLFDGFDREIPRTRIYVQSVLPVNGDSFVPVDAAEIDAINEKLRSEADARGYVFVDLRAAFRDAQGELDRAYSNDGIHLVGAGYEVWRTRIADLVAE